MTNKGAGVDLPTAEWERLLQLAAEARALRGRALPAAAGASLRAQVAGADARFAHPLARAVYAPLILRTAEPPFVLAQVGQSLDGRIATLSGHSHTINGEGALVHLHRLRALVDAVVVGASTAVLDNPQLTTRRVTGCNPVRVVLDPHRRVPPDACLFDAAAPSLRICLAEAGGTVEEGTLTLPSEENGAFAPQAVLAALAGRGLHALLIEGGGETISAFLRAGCLHRLHVLLAPLLIGPGREAFRLPEIARLEAARRFTMAAHPLGSDVLLDCDLQAAG